MPKILPLKESYLSAMEFLCAHEKSVAVGVLSAPRTANMTHCFWSSLSDRNYDSICEYNPRDFYVAVKFKNGSYIETILPNKYYTYILKEESYTENDVMDIIEAENDEIDRFLSEFTIIKDSK